ncbi:hypothetical protein LJY25_11940 [Hymenobacter sp. BT175]|uniref:hypothetical protein n=1 Tax=Hymenobacter translucens TaxID=2886507 RepID=UPI001D0E202F|nr:hypothetical protein [Hymenobacter translucens]MCC2547160.1 hypothetical protein [Hymenobacter translucens]
MNNEKANPSAEESTGAQRVSMANSGQNQFPIKKKPGQQPLQETGSHDRKRAMKDGGADEGENAGAEGNNHKN